jgi:aspartyl-tRNA(Asn)/glutamyl-tRNA(Gln) amidotransferase subunit B
VLEEGGVVYQETRHWDVNARRTIVMRTKETADDYRLFPEPDMVPFDLSEEFVDEVRTRLPELPDQRRDRYVQTFGLKRSDAAQLSGDPALAAFFDQASAGTQGKLAQAVANVMLNELTGYLNAEGQTIATTAITPAQIKSLAELLSTDAISSNQGREVFALMAQSGDDPAHIVDERGMRQVSDTSALEPVVDEVIANCPDQVAQFKDGNTKVVGYLVGQCMKASKGKGNPKLFNQLLTAKLSQ